MSSKNRGLFDPKSEKKNNDGLIDPNKKKKDGEIAEPSKDKTILPKKTDQDDKSIHPQK